MSVLLPVSPVDYIKMAMNQELHVTYKPRSGLARRGCRFLFHPIKTTTNDSTNQPKTEIIKWVDPGLQGSCSWSKRWICGNYKEELWQKMLLCNKHGRWNIRSLRCDFNFSFSSNSSHLAMRCRQKEDSEVPSGSSMMENSWLLCGFLFLNPASPEALHPPCLSISSPGNIIRELTTTVSTRQDLPHMNACSTAITNSRRHTNSFCPPLQLQWSLLASPPSTSVFFFLSFWRSVSFDFLPPPRSAEAWGKQLDSAGCSRGEALGKKQTNQRGLIVF